MHSPVIKSGLQTAEAAASSACFFPRLTGRSTADITSREGRRVLELANLTPSLQLRNRLSYKKRRTENKHYAHGSGSTGRY